MVDTVDAELEEDIETERVSAGKREGSRLADEDFHPHFIRTKHISWLQEPPLDLDDLLPRATRERGSMVATNLTAPGHHIGKTMWSIAFCGFQGLIAPYPGVSPWTVVVTKDRENRSLEVEGLDEVVSPKEFTAMAEDRKFLCVWQRHYPNSSRPSYRMGIRIDYLTNAIESVDGDKYKCCFSFLNPVAIKALNAVLSPGFIPTFWLMANAEDKRAMQLMRGELRHVKKELKKRPNENLGPLGVGELLDMPGRVVIQNRVMRRINGIPVASLSELDRIRAVVPWLREGLDAPLLQYERDAFREGNVWMAQQDPCYPRAKRKEVVEGIMFRMPAIVRGRSWKHRVEYGDELGGTRGKCKYRTAIPVDWEDAQFQPIDPIG